MTNNLGHRAGDGFIPAEPSLQKMMASIGLKSFGAPTEASSETEAAVVSAEAKMQQDFASVFSTPSGERVLENLFDQYLRRSCAHPNPDAGIEQEALYSRERKGQNTVVGYICMMTQAGREQTSKLASKSKKKKS